MSTNLYKHADALLLRLSLGVGHFHSENDWDALLDTIGTQLQASAAAQADANSARSVRTGDGRCSKWREI